MALFFTGIAGLFGTRTPPEPEAIAQMQPAQPRGASLPPGTERPRFTRSDQPGEREPIDEP